MASPPPASAPAPLWSYPHSLRPSHPRHLPSIIAFILLFNLGIILTNLTQLIFYPLSLFPPTSRLYEWILDGTKGSFGQLTVLVSQCFAQTEFVVTFGEGFEGDRERWVRRDAKGEVEGIVLPEKGVWIANHQTLADWMYIWSFTYLSSHHRSILITLKASLKWIPFVGWACQLYGFIFLARKWVEDKGPFGRELDKVARRLKEDENREGLKEGEGRKLALLLFPEGTLVTGNTRPKSLAYAEKLGIPDLKHTLLPRSTGLFFALRTLSPLVPTLSLLDLTISYPGTHLPFYPEDYYSLPSIWFDGIPPPSIHVQLRKWDVRSDVPIGHGTSGEGSEREKEAFEKWLVGRWREKDELMGGVLREGKFGGAEGKGKEGGREVRWKVRLRTRREFAEAFSYFVPVIVCGLAVWGTWRLVAAVGGMGAVGGKTEL